jgi:hypothetical protein
MNLVVNEVKVTFFQYPFQIKANKVFDNIKYQNLQCENSIHVNRKHYVTQNDQESTMHYTLKDHQGSPRAFTSSASPMQKGASA